MRTILRKSLFWGTVIGASFVLIAPFGLSFLFVELLRPILVPAAYIVQILLRPEGNVVRVGLIHWVLLIGLNILIYSAIVFALLSIQDSLKRK